MPYETYFIGETMARITVEDCLERVDNRFNLVRLASLRARDLERNLSDAMLPLENDKPTVLALREIAEGLIDRNYMSQAAETEDAGI